MAEKIKEDKIVLEREYIVPLRKKVNLTHKYRRARKAVKVLIAFVARNMKVYEDKEKMVKVDRYLNEELWSRGIQKPPAKIRVRCKKFESGIVTVELAEVPEFVKFKKAKDIKRAEIRVPSKPVEKKTEPGKEEERKEEEKKEIQEEGAKSEVESGLKHQDQQAKEMKHVIKNTQKGQKIKRQPIQRMAMQK